jgi:2',3'-cyclic-nucleotide 2'-phosphodiesterase (5'-nucleotidase family)
MLAYLLAVAVTSLLSMPGLAAVPPAYPETARLTVLHTTDLHGALTAYDYLADQPAPAGLVRIASLVRAARAEGPPVLLLDDGDAIQGGALETYYWRGDRARPEPMMAAMTRLGSRDWRRRAPRPASPGWPPTWCARRTAAPPSAPRS